MKHLGQNLSETSFLLGIVGIVCLGALGVLGTQVSGMFAGTIRTSSEKPPVMVKAAQSQSLPANPYSNFPSREVVINLGKGKSITANIIDPALLAETAGGNGVSEYSSDMLLSIAKQLKAEEAIDEEQYDALAELALRGQRIKEAQKLLESKFPIKGFRNAQEKFDFLQSHTVEWDGKNQSLLTLAYSLNVHQDTSKINDFNYFSLYSQDRNGYFSGSEENNYDSSFSFREAQSRDNKGWPPLDGIKTPMQQFLSQLALVEDKGITKNPALMTLIKDTFAKNIYLSSNTTLFTPNKAEVGSLMEMTRKNANNICDTSLKQVKCSDPIAAGGSSQGES